MSMLHRLRRLSRLIVRLRAGRPLHCFAAVTLLPLPPLRTWTDKAGASTSCPSYCFCAFGSSLSHQNSEGLTFALRPPPQSDRTAFLWETGPNRWVTTTKAAAASTLTLASTKVRKTFGPANELVERACRRNIGASHRIKQQAKRW